MSKQQINDDVNNRKVIHIDMDAFYASVEQRDNPGLRGKPVIVGGSPNSRGVVAACSYEARRFGIRSAMASAKAYRLCPAAIFVPPRFGIYKEISNQLHAIYQDFSNIIEPLALDEAFLDVTDSNRWQGSASLIAKEIKTRIKLQTGLIASAGISYNKFLAKIASDMDKPDGFYLITPERALEFIAGLPVARFFGVGKVTEQKMHALGIKTGADLQRWSEQSLIDHFGKAGRFYYCMAHGVDSRPVNSSRLRKSISKERTFAEDLDDMAYMLEVLVELADKVSDSLVSNHLLAQSMYIKVKFFDFKQVTRSQTLAVPSQHLSDFRKGLANLLAKATVNLKPVRLLGFGVNRLQPVKPDASYQMELLE